MGIPMSDKSVMAKMAIIPTFIPIYPHKKPIGCYCLLYGDIEIALGKKLLTIPAIC